MFRCICEETIVTINKEGTLMPDDVIIVQPVVTGGGTVAVPDSAIVKNHIIPAFQPLPLQHKLGGILL